jgi:hypothetical protein
VIYKLGPYDPLFLALISLNWIRVWPRIYFKLIYSWWQLTIISG